MTADEFFDLAGDGIIWICIGLLAPLWLPGLGIRWIASRFILKEKP